jgi:formylglycine-generating enzyme required for sulfatase activity
VAHHDRAWRRCEDCVAEEKRKAEEQEAARRADEQRKAKEAAARAEAERRRAAEAAKEEAKRKQEEKRRLTAAPEWAKVSEQQKQAAVAVGFPVARELDLGGVALRMVLIPSGEFMMGSPNNEAQRDNNDEGPVHRVHIARPFYMGIHEVTQEQWQAVMGSNPAGFKGPKNPVENVSWDDCQEFCKKVSQKTGLTLRLPTEAEWEYACRAGTTTPFYFGETISTEQANYDGNYTYGNGRKGEDRQRTTPVGSFAPNAFGLYDMHGNVLEWCQDWYGEDYYGKSPAEDPQGPESGQYRVRRGGAWLNGPGYTRSANRSWSTPGNWNSYFGFRAVVSVAR